MVDNVNITGIDDRAKATLENLGWAKETTLQKLVSNSSVAARLLGKIAEAQGIEEAAVSRLLSGLHRTHRDAPRMAAHAGAIAGEEVAERSSKRLNDSLNRIQGRMSSSYSAILQSQNDQVGNIFRSVGTTTQRFGSTLGGITGTLVVSFGALIAVVGTAVNTIQEIHNITRGMYTAGIRPEGGFNALADAAIATGISMRGLADIITRFGGVAVTLGTRRMMTLQSQFARMTNSGADFMMNQEESQQAFLDSVEMLRISNQLSSMSDIQILNSSRQMVANFNELALATGKNRDELRQSTLALMQQTRIFGLSRAGAAGGAIQGLVRELTAEFGQGAGPLAQMIEGMFMGGPALISEQFRPLLAILPNFANSLSDITQGLRTGAIDPREAARRFSDIFNNIDQSSLQILRAAKPELYDFIVSQRQASQQAREARERLAALTDEQRETLRGEQKRDEQRQTTLNSLQSGFRAIITGMSTLLADLVEPLMPIFGALGKSMTGSVEAFREHLQPHIRSFGEWIQQTLGGGLVPIFERFKTWITNLVTAISGVNWGELGSNLSAFASGVGSVVRAAGWVASTTSSVVGAASRAGEFVASPSAYYARRRQEAEQERLRAAQQPPVNVTQQNDAARQRVATIAPRTGNIPAPVVPTQEPRANPTIPQVTPTSASIPVIRPQTPSTPVTAPAAAPTASAPVPTITMDQLNLRTARYYEDSIQKMVQSVEFLDKIRELLEKLDRTSDSGAARIVGAIESSGSRIR